MRCFPLVLLVLAAVMAGCAPSHRLAEVELSGRTVAVMAAIPPGPRVVTGPWPFLDRPVTAPPGPARRRYEAARAAQSRLDSAAVRVDVAEVLARRALLESGRALGFRPVSDPDEADFILDVRLLDYGLYAASFESVVLFVAEADVLLLRRGSGEVVWQRRIREREPVRAELFGLDEEAGSRLTAQRLTRLSTDEMALGLAYLADFAAERVARGLSTAYAESR
jgi:hypothetical protein